MSSMSPPDEAAAGLTLGVYLCAISVTCTVGRLPRNFAGCLIGIVRLLKGAVSFGRCAKVGVATDKTDAITTNSANEIRIIVPSVTPHRKTVQMVAVAELIV